MNAREQDRTGIIYNLKVEDRDSDRLLGYIVNINPRGVMLISDRPEVTPRSVNLRVHLPRNVMHEGSFDATGELRWCRRRNTEDYTIGVRLVSVPEPAKQHLSDLIERFHQVETPDDEGTDPYLQESDLPEIT